MEDRDLKMWSYRIVHDKQFAPNPFKGVLTLATCKPLIRRSKESESGVWLAGFAAYSVKDGLRPKKGRELLIYLAKISEVMTMQDYWKEYPQKRAQKCGEEFEEHYGDNIYDENLRLVNDNNHGEWDFKRDISGKNVLICKEFYYFAPDSRLVVPNEFEELVYKRRGQTLVQNNDLIQKFIDYVRSCAKDDFGKQQGILGDIKRIEYSTGGNCSSSGTPTLSSGCGVSSQQLPKNHKNSCG
ncbi:MAG: hypothetical protein UH853_09670 [Muribaculaceae bacterium]|nr:hypothetical protein [Muribaculaceae bacterium]